MKPYPSSRDLELLSGATWHDLAELEPRLGELLWEARQASVTCRRWSDVDRVFAPIRNTLADLVGITGQNHRHPVLASPEAYQVAYWKVYDAVAGLLPGHPATAEQALDRHGGATPAEPCRPPLATTAAAAD
jgi:hypothetical protein